MRPSERPIGDLVDKCATWNPKHNGCDTFDYIDLSSVDKDVKAITAVERQACSEAPSRARQLVESGDVLVATVRPNLNGVALVGPPHGGMTASTGYCVLRPKGWLLDSHYLFHWVRTSAFVERMVKMATGANYPAVSDAKVRRSGIPYVPIAEQKRIAAILDAADALRAKRRESLAELDALVQSVFLDMFGDPVTNPMGWEMGSLKDVTEKITDGTHKTPAYTESGIEFLSAKDVRDGEIRWNTGKFISPEEHAHLIRRCNPEPGDLLLAKSGSLGSVAVIDRDHEFSLFESLCLIKRDSKRVDASFLACMLGNPTMQVHLLRKNKGVAVRHLHLVDIRGLQILVPPMRLQREFAAIVAAVQEQRLRQREHLAELDTLFGSLQVRAFDGEL